MHKTNCRAPRGRVPTRGKAEPGYYHSHLMDTERWQREGGNKKRARGGLPQQHSRGDYCLRRSESRWTTHTHRGYCNKGCVPCGGLGPSVPSPRCHASPTKMSGSTRRRAQPCNHQDTHLTLRKVRGKTHPGRSSYGHHGDGPVGSQAYSPWQYPQPGKDPTEL